MFTVYIDKDVLELVYFVVHKGVRFLKGTHEHMSDEAVVSHQDRDSLFYHLDISFYIVCVSVSVVNLLGFIS